MLLWEDEVLYRGEGNSSLVIQLQKSRHVVRLLKNPKSPAALTPDQILALLKAHIRFNERVLTRLLPHVFFRAPQLVRLNDSQLASIHALQDQRPAHRLAKNIPSRAHNVFALLLPDYCSLPRALTVSGQLSGPVIAVEIKPKQGFLPAEHLLSDELRVKAHVCRFGLNQFHKLNKGSIVARSHYCPLDLFSGCPQRQTRALHALIASPQNNLRVFRDLHYAFGEQSNHALDDVIRDLFPDDDNDDSRRRDAFCRLLVVALNKRFAETPPLSVEPGWSTNQSCGLHPSRCTCQTKHVLEDGSVLAAVLCAQRLDSIDSQLANEWWAGLTNNNEGEGLEGRLSGDWLPESFGAREERTSGETESSYRARKVWQFLVSLTAKDCSIMVALQRVEGAAPELDEHVVSEGGVRFVASVRVTDLDQKRHLKIQRTLLNDLRMVRALNNK